MIELKDTLRKAGRKNSLVRAVIQITETRGTICIFKQQSNLIMEKVGRSPSWVVATPAQRTFSAF